MAALVATLALILWTRHGPRPLVFYFGSSYAVGLLPSVAAKLA